MVHVVLNMDTLLEGGPGAVPQSKTHNAGLTSIEQFLYNHTAHLHIQGEEYTGLQWILTRL